jgi:hypothetical protein
MNESAIILAPTIPLTGITIAPQAIAIKDSALAGSALIGKVTNAAENEAAARALAMQQAKRSCVQRVVVLHPCENCGTPVEVEPWEKEKVSSGYLITCDDPRCHRYGMYRMGWAQQLG